MKSHALRLYVVSIAVLVFFVLWAIVAAKPWAAQASSRPAVDPRLAALARQERRLRHESVVINKTLSRRWSDYRRRLKARQALIRAVEQRHAQELAAASAASSSYSYASAPAGPAAGTTRVVTLPPRVTVVSLPPAGASTGSGSSHP